MGLLDWLTEGLGPNGGMPPSGALEQQANPLLPPMPPERGFGMDAPNLADPMTQAMPGGQGGGVGQPPVPLPQPRPAGAGLPQPPTDLSAAAAAPGAPLNLAPPPGGMMAQSAMPQPPQQGAAASLLGRALGLSPERDRQVSSSLAAGLKSVGENYKKPGLAALAGSTGAAMEGGEKRTDKDTDQRTKLIQQAISAQAAGDRAGYLKSMMQINNLKLQQAADPQAAAKAKASMTDEQKAVKVLELLNNDIQLKGIKSTLATLQKQGTPAEIAAAQKKFDELYATKQKEFGERLRAGSQYNPLTYTSADDLRKNAQKGDIFRNPKDGKLYVYDPGAKASGGQKAGAADAATPSSPRAAMAAMTPDAMAMAGDDTDEDAA